jgi:SPP1 gp7 family putative phage head morphogenesis protein
MQLQHRLMVKYVSPVYNALQKQVAESIALVKEKGIEAAYSQTFHQYYINPWIGPVIKSLYIDAGKQAAARTTVVKSLIIPLIGFVREVIDYFNQYIFSKIVLPISQTTLKDIQKVLKQAISDGWGIEKTVRELKDNSITKYRAQMIVRTESVAAMNYAQLKVASEKPYETTKRWIAVEDKRTRLAHTHAGVDGEVRDLNEPFSNGLQFPGDPDGPAAQVINCRCTMSYRAKRDQDGQIIMKPKQTALATA